MGEGVPGGGHSRCRSEKPDSVEDRTPILSEGELGGAGTWLEAGDQLGMGTKGPE